MDKPARKPLHLLEMVIPGIKVVRTYQRSWLPPDLIAGATIFAILVPQGMAYGELAGVDPVVGLYTALAALFAYALFGSSRQLMFGPEATSAILVATAVAPLAAGGDPARYVTLTALLALLVGAVALIAGLARIGFLADFVSRPILIGFMIGAALIIISSQLGKLFGFKITGDNFFQKIWELLGHLDQTSWLTLLIGLTLITFLIVLRRFARKAPGAIIVVIVLTVLSVLLHLDKYGVQVVGQIPAGLPKPAVPDIRLADVLALLPSAFTLALIFFTSNVLTARTFAEKYGEKVDGNQEFIALGAANIFSSLIGGFPPAASQSRTVVNDEARGKTQVAGIVTAALLVVFLLWFTSLLSSLPQVALAAIIIAAALNLIDFKPLQEVYRIRRTEFYLALVTLLGVLSVGVLEGILVAVFLSLLLVISRISRPHTAVLGAVEGIDGYHDIEAHTSSQTQPGLIAYRFDAPLFFANADYFLTQVRELIAAADAVVECVVIDAEAIIDIDVTAADAMKKLFRELEQKGIVLGIARVSLPLQKMLKRSGLRDLIGSEHIYPTVHTAVQAYRERKGEVATET